MAKLIRIHGLVLLAVILVGSAGHAQQTDSNKTDSDKNDLREQPVAPYPASIATSSASDSSLDIPQAPTGDVQIGGDDHPVSGVDEHAAVPAGRVRNFVLPSVSVMSQIGTSSSGSGYSSPTVLTYLLGNLELNHLSDRSQLLVNYTGGEMLSSYLNSAEQNLEFSYNFNWQRWSLLVGDQTSYLSESPFGFGGIGGLAFLNGDSQFGPGGLVGIFLNGSLSPNQTIPTIIVPRLSNTVVSQITYKLSPRSTWTASGTFGTLNFLGADYIDSMQGQFQTGYNYLITPASSIAAIYRFDAFRFSYLPQEIEDNVFELGYGRYVTGRMSLQLAAGPSLQMLRGFLTGYGNRLSWAVDGLVNYKLDRTTFLLTYSHLLTGGSGVLVGAETSQVEATAERKLNPRWRASATVGYATNSSLVPINYIVGSGSYNSWYVAIQFNHQWRPGSDLFMGYGARLQAINAAACAVPNCGGAPLGQQVGHEFSAGFNFDFRPRGLP